MIAIISLKEYKQVLVIPKGYFPFYGPYIHIYVEHI